MRIPQSIVAANTHDIFIKSCQINYSVDQPTGVKVCILYPDCFNDFAILLTGNPKLVNKPATKNGIIMPNPKQKLYLSQHDIWEKIFHSLS